MTDLELEELKKEEEKARKEFNEKLEMVKAGFTAFLSDFTDKEIKVVFSVNFGEEFRVEVDFVEDGKTVFGANFSMYYNFIRSKHNIIQINNGTVGSYSLEEDPYIVERSIMIGKIWCQINSFKKRFEEYTTLLKPLSEKAFNLECEIERERLRRIEEADNIAIVQTQAEIETDNYSLVETINDWKYTLTISKILKTNYECKISRDYIGAYPNYYIPHCEMVKRINKGDLIYRIKNNCQVANKLYKFK